MYELGLCYNQEKAGKANKKMNLISQYRGLRKENYILCFGGFVTSMGSMVRPMLTMILSQKLGMNAVQVAWITALMGLMTLPANLVGGRMADRLNKKMNIVYLDIVSVISYVVCAWIPLSGASIVLMFIASTCQSMERPSYNSLIADISLTKDRERSYSLHYLLSNLGGIMASVLAGFMFHKYLWLAFLFSGIAIGMSTLLIYTFVRDITPVKDDGQGAAYQEARSGESLLTILKENRLVLLFVLLVGGYMSVYQMYSYLVPMDLLRLHGDNGAVIYGTVTSVNCLIVVIFTPVLTRVLQRFSEPVKMIYGYLLTLAGYVIYVIFIGHIPFYYAAMVVMTWGEIASMLAESPYLTRRIPSSHRGRVHGLVDITRTGIMSGYQLLIGVIYKNHTFSFTWVFVILTGVFFLGLAGMLAVWDKNRYRGLYDISIRKVERKLHESR